MPRLKRAELAAEAARRNREQLARAGGELRLSRRRRPDAGTARSDRRSRPIDDQPDGAWPRRITVDGRVAACVRRAGSPPRRRPTPRSALRAGGRRPSPDTGACSAQRSAGRTSSDVRAAVTSRGFGTLDGRRTPQRSAAHPGADRMLERHRRYRRRSAIDLEEGRGCRDGRRIGRGRSTLPRGIVLGHSGDAPQPRACRAISGGLRAPVPGFVSCVGRSDDDGQRAAGRARSRLVRRGGNAVVCVASCGSLIGSLTRGRDIPTLAPRQTPDGTPPVPGWLGARAAHSV
jgi:hypothetical protein